MQAASALMTTLQRVLGLRDAVAIGIGGTVGGGVYVLIGAAAGSAGPAALVALGIAFAAALAIALPYAELACRMPLAGGAYAFARAVFGERAGVAAGLVYWLAYVFVSGYVTLGFGTYLGLPHTLGALGLIAACLLLNLIGVKVSARAQQVVVAAAILGLAGFALYRLPDVHAGNFSPFAPHGPGSIFHAALLFFLAFGGFDMVAAAGEEIEQPERNLRRAILITLATVLVLYLAVAVTVIGSGRALAGGLVAPIALLTTAATANAVLIVTSRVTFAMRRSDLKRHLAFNAALMAVVAATGSVALAARVGGFLYALHFVAPLAALLVLRRRDGRGTGLVPVALAACAAMAIAALWP
jgi:APA family basic amino acid/polyamine antiporter